MMTLISLGLFAAAMAAIGAVFWLTLVPALPRIAELLAGEAHLAPLTPPPALQPALVPVRKAAITPPPAWRAAA